MQKPNKSFILERCNFFYLTLFFIISIQSSISAQPLLTTTPLPSTAMLVAHSASTKPIVAQPSVHNMTADNLQCRQIIASLFYTRKHANNTLKSLGFLYGVYVRVQFDKAADQMETFWKFHEVSMKLLSEKSAGLDYSEISKLHTNMTLQILSYELYKIHRTLRKLDNMFGEIVAQRERYKHINIHELGKNVERNKKIDDFFDRAYTYIRTDLEELEIAMRKLKMPTVGGDEVIVEYPKVALVREFILAREHLSVMRYVCALYEEIFRYCSKEQNLV